MECTVRDPGGRRLRLPTVLEWDFTYALGAPCDSFEVVCLWEPGEEEELEPFHRFTAVEAGERVFTGVVDEFRCLSDERGCRLELAGRGMEALLLDNEAQAAEYQTALWADIKRDHLDPYGIQVAGSPSLPPARSFAVTSGSSEWRVLYDFACYRGGITPRFDRQGRLVLDPWEKTCRRVLGEDTPVTRMAWGQDRYGVLSQVTVWDRKGRGTATVRNQDFLAAGGSCRRVVSAASGTGRYSGEFQIRASQAEMHTGEFTVPSAFWAWPGELVRVERKGLGTRGLYRVRQTRVRCGGEGVSTAVTVGPADEVM